MTARCTMVCVALLTAPGLVPGRTGIAAHAAVEKIADGFAFTEGPCWRKAGYLVFSDITGDKVLRWSSEGGCQVLLTPSGKANGIAEDSQGRLILAQQGARRLVRIEPDGGQTVLASTYNAKPLNSPNDIAVRSDGTIYFTDPPYGVQPSQERLGFYGVYRVRPNAEPQLLVDSLRRPNGIVFSPDEAAVYIGDTDAARVLVYRAMPDGTFLEGRVFAFLGAPRYVDGLDVDRFGNVYCAGTTGWIWVLSPQGALIDSIAVPGKTTNVQWGGPGGGTLFITSGTSVYRMVTSDVSARFPPTRAPFVSARQPQGGVFACLRSRPVDFVTLLYVDGNAVPHSPNGRMLTLHTRSGR